MSKQLTIPGFPEQLFREAYTAPKQPVNPYPAPKLWQPLTQCISVQPEYFTLFNDMSPFKGRSRYRGGYTPPTVKRILNTGTMSRSCSSKMKRAMNYLFL